MADIRAYVTPTVTELVQSEVSQTAMRNWLGIDISKVSFQPDLVNDIYDVELKEKSYPSKTIVLLEYLKYLEYYLWQFYDPETSSVQHCLSIVLLLNEKCRIKSLLLWSCIKSKDACFDGLFCNVLRYLIDGKENFSYFERTALLRFVNNCFNSLEFKFLRQSITAITSIYIWSNLMPRRLEDELGKNRKISRFYKGIENKMSSMTDGHLEIHMLKTTFISRLIKQFFEELPDVCVDGHSSEALLYIETILEFFVDLFSILTTRRFLTVLFDDHHFIVKVKLLPIFDNQRKEYFRFNKLFNLLQMYCNYDIDEYTGDILNQNQIIRKYYDNIFFLQKLLYKHYGKIPEIREVCMSSIRRIDFERLLNYLSYSQLLTVCQSLFLVPSDATEETYDAVYLYHLLRNRFSLKGSYEMFIHCIKEFLDSPVFPTEKILWNEDVFSHDLFAIPKLSLQFLTFNDYLLRNYHLYFIESASHIKDNLEDVVGRLKPYFNNEGVLAFAGWARMGQEILSFTVTGVGNKNIGVPYPSYVTATLKVNLAVRTQYVDEWDALRPGDPCFLVSFRTDRVIYGERHSDSFLERYGITAVRGCTIDEVLKKDLDDPSYYSDSERVIHVKLDPAQYQIDEDDENLGIYQGFSVIIRKKPKESTFKAVLETIRALVKESSDCVALVPPWFSDILIGYGDPLEAHYSRICSLPQTIHFNDTFLDKDHVYESYPDFKVAFNGSNPPYKITFLKDNELSVESCGLPLAKGVKSKNSVRYTPVQIEAIRSGLQKGLTIIVGPPGTGKTDVAVQIISDLYHTHPTQKTLILAHSNQALNQIFEKMINLGVEEKHLLRMGHGEESLETKKDFSRNGRIDYILGRRIELLEKVKSLEQILQLPNAEHTCETAYNFYLYEILTRWKKYLNSINEETPKETIAVNFPFKAYFPEVDFSDNDLFSVDYVNDLFISIKAVFEELKEFRAFELLMSGSARNKFLMIKMARIIAMTCTFSAIRRQELREMSLQYDTLLMEETAQILEIETLIPLTLQSESDKRLKRIIFIGDHHQLPPVIKNENLRQYSNMDQSMFQRFIRIGVKYVQLDYQGRCRPNIYELISSRYENTINHLDHVKRFEDQCNPGFAFEFQLINVEFYVSGGRELSVCETEPVPYYYQNEQEAEYAVSLFVYMRLIGYPAKKITILAMYNGQKHLIRDILRKRCERNPILGMPLKITTVDRYQGQQNDYVIVSMTRTKSIGYLRNLRRLVVAFSRGRLGLYVLACTPLFTKYDELKEMLSLFNRNPNQLYLYPNEHYEKTRRHLYFYKNEEPYIVNNVNSLSDLAQKLYMERYVQLEIEYKEMKSNVDVAKEKYEIEKSKFSEKVDQVEQDILNEILDEK